MMVLNLVQALNIIKSTMYHRDKKAYFPYFFIVGAGISVPEIPSASKIVDICKDTVKRMAPELFDQYEEDSKAYLEDGMKYYSAWIEYAYPNRINRSQLFRNLSSTAKISSANLMLAQILHSNQFANTVFTTNFDDSIKKALELMGTRDFFCAENIMDNLVVSNQSTDIQVIHVHGTFNFYDCANLEKEIDDVASKTGTISSSQVLASFLANQAPIIVGYSGWENDVIMRCLKERLSLPTPLQYIWICYNKQSYLALPGWIKENDNVIFVVPESDNNECSDTGDPLAWSTSNSAATIDATMFFKRIISSFELKSPLIFKDPYSYYSQKIQSLLPKDEDVLHLRHWAQRLKIVESDNAFEELVQKMEAFYTAKDYVEANKVLLEMIELSLNEANAEFVCTSLIKEFIRDEDVISSFEDRLNLHLTALTFVEKNLSQLSNTAGLISTLRAILFTRFQYSKKDKLLELVDKVIALTSTDERLLVVELTALGMKSDLVERESKLALLNEILLRCPEELSNKNFAFLKYKALRELARCTYSNEAIALIEQAEHISSILNDDIYGVYLCLTKSEVLPFINEEKTKEQWGKDIVKVLSNVVDDVDPDLYIEIAANISLLTDDELFNVLDRCQIESIVTGVLSNYPLDQSSCHSILHYSQCCEVICRATDTTATLTNYCEKVFDFIPSFPHKCKNYLSTLRTLVDKYISLPKEIVDDSCKINLIARIKENENTKDFYLSVLYHVLHENLIEDLSLFSCDLKYLLEQKEKVTKGYELYRGGEKKQAEELFIAAMSSKERTIAESAITNLAYMVRRNETEHEFSFEELIGRIQYWGVFDLMNILLYYTTRGETSSKQYLIAKERMSKASEDERKAILEWWGDTTLVGEEESKLALSFIFE